MEVLQSTDRHGETRTGPSALQAATRNLQPATTLGVPSRPELWIFIALIAIFSGPTLWGSSCRSMAFKADAVAHGEWWRILTHPFVHVTWYHLLLDATAFLTLYAGLLDQSLPRRLTFVVGGGAGSLLLSCCAFTSSQQTLCGLSGIAHGLMAVSALEMADSNDLALKRLGWTSFGLVIGKAAFEAATGKMFFACLGFGMLGDPVAVSHAGGVIGSLSVLLLLNRLCHHRLFGLRIQTSRLSSHAGNQREKRALLVQ